MSGPTSRCTTGRESLGTLFIRRNLTMPNSTPADEATATCPKCGAAQSRHKGEAKVSFGQWRHDGDLLPMWECYTWFEDKKPSLQCQLACANQQIDELKGKLGEGTKLIGRAHVFAVAY